LIRLGYFRLPLKNHLHKSMIDGCLLSSRPFQKVVKFSLKLSILDVSTGGTVVEGFAQKTDPMVGQAAARTAISGPAGPPFLGVSVVQLQTEKNGLKTF
jgi:hypothetical protein